MVNRIILPENAINHWICLYLLVITVDIIFIVWLVTDGKHILSSIIDFDFFYKVVDAVLC